MDRGFDELESVVMLPQIPQSTFGSVFRSKSSGKARSIPSTFWTTTKKAAKRKAGRTTRKEIRKSKKLHLIISVLSLTFACTAFNSSFKESPRRVPVLVKVLLG